MVEVPVEERDERELKDFGWGREATGAAGCVWVVCVRVSVCA